MMLVQNFVFLSSNNEQWLDPKSNICTLSFGTQRVMKFKRPGSASTTDGNDPELIDVVTAC